MTPRVTIVTSTWHRTGTLINVACASVATQTWPNLEHLVMIDGDDADTRVALHNAGYRANHHSDRRYCFLGRNWSEYSGDGGFGSTCRMTGAWLASGDFITYLDDDNEYDPGHIAEMVQHFADDTDFVTCAWRGNNANACNADPGVGRTDTNAIMHRAMVLKKAGGFALDGYCGDGHMVERWKAAGLHHVYKESRTVHIPLSRHGAAD
jgi:glycosyltransferase involved in cell wall biosynthesis